MLCCSKLVIFLKSSASALALSKSLLRMTSASALLPSFCLSARFSARRHSILSKMASSVAGDGAVEAAPEDDGDDDFDVRSRLDSADIVRYPTLTRAFPDE